MDGESRNKVSIGHSFDSHDWAWRSPVGLWYSWKAMVALMRMIDQGENLLCNALIVASEMMPALKPNNVRFAIGHPFGHAIPFVQLVQQYAPPSPSPQ